MAINHKQAFIAFPKGAEDTQLLVLQFNTFSSKPNWDLLHGIQQYLKENYPSEFVNSKMEIEPNSYLRIVSALKEPVSDEHKEALNKIVRDFKFYADDNGFDVTFDNTAKHLIKSYQGTNVQLQLSPTVGFTTNHSRLESQRIYDALQENKENLIDSPIADQYSYLFQWEKQQQTIEDYILDKHIELESTYKTPLYLPVLLTENEDHYLLTVDKLSEGDTNFIFNTLDDMLDQPMGLNKTDEGFQLALPKSEEVLKEIYSIAFTHKMKLTVNEVNLREDLDKIISLPLYPVRNVEGDMFFTNQKSNSMTR